MNIRSGFAILLLSLFSGLMARAQSAESSSGITEPPKLLLLVHQQIKFGLARRANARSWEWPSSALAIG